MIKDKSKNSILTMRYFYNLFLKRKRKYPISYFLFYIKTRKKTIALPNSQIFFYKIISTYLDIYFRELYFNNTPKYFFLSGLIKKCKGKQYFANPKQGVKSKNRSIVWLWYQRPTIAFFSNMKLLKLKGRTGKVPKLDNDYRFNKDVELLPPIRSEMRNVPLFK